MLPSVWNSTKLGVIWLDIWKRKCTGRCLGWLVFMLREKIGYSFLRIRKFLLPPPPLPHWKENTLCSYGETVWNGIALPFTGSYIHKVALPFHALQIFSITSSKDRIIPERNFYRGVKCIKLIYLTLSVSTASNSSKVQPAARDAHS